MVIKTLGQDQVLVNGQAVHWPSRATRDLFYVLLISPHGHTKAEITELLWGNASSSESNSNFKVTHFRMRQALGDQGATLESGGRYTLAARYYASADHLQFQEELQATRTAASREDRLRHFYRAIELYQGDFLPDHPTDWAEEVRSTLRAAYVRARLEVAQLHCSAVECQLGVRNLAQALATDPLIGEHYHQDLMTCLCTLRKPDDALSHYRHFLTFIQRDIGDTPMAATVQLADQIRGNQPHLARHIGAQTPCPRRMLYGVSAVLPATRPQLEPVLLEQAVTRGLRILNLMKEASGAQDWSTLARTVEAFLADVLETSYVAVVPASPLTDGSKAPVLELASLTWPPEAYSAVHTAFDAATSVSDEAAMVAPAVPSLVEVVVYPVGKHSVSEHPIAWICLARSGGRPLRDSGEFELLNSVSSVLEYVLTGPDWLPSFSPDQFFGEYPPR